MDESNRLIAKALDATDESCLAEARKRFPVNGTGGPSAYATAFGALLGDHHRLARKFRDYLDAGKERTDADPQ